MSVWLDGVVQEDAWRSQERRLLVVCPEPNEDWMNLVGDRRRDMRELLRRPIGDRKRFYVQLRQLIRAFHSLPSRPDAGEEQEHGDLVRRIAFIDLKNTGGGQSTDPERIMKETAGRRQEIVTQIRSIVPTHIAVAGGNAQKAFDRHIRGHIPAAMGVCGVRHPSWRWGTAADYFAVVHTEFRRANWLS
jgi:hypothetical protein